MSDDTGSRVGRVIVIGLLMAGTLGFGLAGLCGAAFTAIGMAGVTFSERSDPYAVAIFVISVPSLLIGGGLGWWCLRLLARRWRDDA
ncbi:MAG: hypothetical protein EOP35_01380 [Rubrivivax sp.]|nr:MAG: hypothetical protein EOP35_01380 [Rubrivivax sp.]